MIVYKAPQTFHKDINFKKIKTIFLAGSIDMGSAENWQEQITNKLQDYNIMLLNPRRDDWDSSWTQSIDNPKFHEQVSWELYGLTQSDIIAMYFADDSKSPITLLELGLHALDDKLIVYCSNKFYRKGNVDVVAKYYNFPVYDDKDKWFNAVVEKIK
jgi:hypothetical protein